MHRSTIIIVDLKKFKNAILYGIACGLLINLLDNIALNAPKLLEQQKLISELTETETEVITEQTDLVNV
jgi:hypothetical protein